LREKGCAFEMVHVDLSNKPPWFRQVNPRGLVPALEVPGGTILVESLAICKWVDENVGGVDLMPAEEEPGGGMRRQEALDFVDNVADRIVSSGLAAVAGSGRSWGIGAKPEVSRMEEDLGRLERMLSATKGPFLAGSFLTLCDLAVFPFLERFDVALKVNGSGERDSIRGVNERVGQWMDEMAKRPSCVWAAANESLLLEAYREHGCLDFFDYTTYEESDLHPHWQRD